MNNSFFVYLLESSICQFFFYLVYIIFLKKETYFNINRTYLLCSVVLSLLIPTIKIEREIPAKNTPAVSNISESMAIITAPLQSTTAIIKNKIESSVDALSILLVIYLIGMVILFAKFIYQFFRLMIFIKKGEVVVKNRHYMICSNGQYPTSSFFKYILWDNTVALSDTEINQIIKHEMTHVNHLHTLDNLLMEIIGVIFWFSPMVYLYNKELKEIHEYIADNEVLNNDEYTRDDYQILINKQVLNNIGFQLSNNFNMSNLKTRIAMITKPKSGKIATLKIFIALPIIALMMLAFSLSYSELIAQNPVVAKTNGLEDKQESEIYTSIGGIREGELSVPQLIAAGELQINSKKYAIVKFDMTSATKAEKDEIFVTCSSYPGRTEFTTEMLSLIKQAKPGQKIYFENVQAYLKEDNFNSGPYIKLPGVILKIEDTKRSVNEGIRKSPFVITTDGVVRIYKASVLTLLYAGKLEININDKPMEILSYMMVFLHKGEIDDSNGKGHRATTSASAEFTEEIRNVFRNEAKQGDRFLFRDIKAKDNDGSFSEIHDVLIEIEGDANATIINSQVIKKEELQSLILEGKFNGKNIFVQNPFTNDGDGFCVKKVIVDGKTVESKINSPAFEIELGKLNLQTGDKVKIELEYEKSNQAPKFLNPEVITKVEKDESVSTKDVHVFVLGGQEQYSTVKKLLEAGKIEMNTEKYTVVSFDMTIEAPDGTLSKMTSTSETFTDEMKNTIKTLKPKQKIYFESISATTKDRNGALKKLPGVIVKIIE